MMVLVGNVHGSVIVVASMSFGKVRLEPCLVCGILRVEFLRCQERPARRNAISHVPGGPRMNSTG